VDQTRQLIHVNQVAESVTVQKMKLWRSANQHLVFLTGVELELASLLHCYSHSSEHSNKLI